MTEIGYDAPSVSKNVIIVGGGLAGLAASIYLARGGRTVTLFERRANLGGRAVTHLRHGFRFNLGPHAFYRGGAGAAVLHELGIPFRGGVVKSSGVALVGSERYRFPGGPISMMTSGLLPAGAKAEAAKVFLRIRRIKPKSVEGMTASEWIEKNVSNARLRQTIEALMRLATYSDHPEQQSAAAALWQLRLSIRKGVTYIDEGWQKIVDAMHSSAVAAGVNFINSANIVSVAHDGAVRGIELGGLDEEQVYNDTVSVTTPASRPTERGTLLKADTVILAVDPTTAGDLVPDLRIADLRPVTATCLDVALSNLPQPKPSFALGIDRPLYFSVHSRWAQLTPKGGALIHVAKYRKSRGAQSEEELESSGVRRTARAAADEQELEQFLDEMQPGWRDVVVHRRFLPSMTVANTLVRPSLPRPAAVTPIQGLYLAGDWIGDEGILSDASLASARAAAKAILAL